MKLGDREGYQNIHITVTQEMAPSARIVVFGVTNNIITGDSLWLDVENKCKNPDKNEVSINSL
jgi:hypothetical protein